MVHSALDMGSHIDPMSSVLVKVGHCQEQFFGNVCWKLAKVRKQLEKEEVHSMAGGGNDRLASLNEEL